MWLILLSGIQKWKGLSNPKSNSEQFNPEEEGGSGFPIDPSGGSLFKGHLAPNGTSRGSVNMHGAEGGPRFSSQVYSSGHSGAELRTQRSYKPQAGAAQLSRFSNSVAVRGSSRFDLSRDDSVHSQWPEERLNGKYSRLNESDSSHSLLGLPTSSYKKDQAAESQQYVLVRD